MLKKIEESLDIYMLFGVYMVMGIMMVYIRGEILLGCGVVCGVFSGMIFLQLIYAFVMVNMIFVKETEGFFLTKKRFFYFVLWGMILVYSMFIYKGIVERGI